MYIYVCMTEREKIKLYLKVQEHTTKPNHTYNFISKQYFNNYQSYIYTF